MEFVQYLTVTIKRSTSLHLTHEFPYPIFSPCSPEETEQESKQLGRHLSLSQGYPTANVGAVGHSGVECNTKFGSCLFMRGAVLKATKSLFHFSATLGIVG